MKNRSKTQLRNALIDSLESRLLFDASVTPTPAEQYALALINRARANPVAEITRVANDPSWNGATPDLNEGLPAGSISAAAQQPVAFSPLLTTGGRAHSQWIIDTGNFAHNEGTTANPITPRDRDVAAGYNFGAAGVEGESITSGYLGTGVSIQSAVDYSQAITMSDQSANDPGSVRGHRRNTFNPAWNEIGIGAATGTFQNANDIILTEDYANAGNGPFLTGVAYNDLNGDRFYEPGEELGGVTITAVRSSDNAVFTTTTWSSGGYNLALTPGNYTVTASGGNVGSPAPQMVTIGTQNVEGDFISGTAQPTTPAAPMIVNTPQSQTVPLNNNVSLAVSFTSNPTATVQWQVSSSGGAFSNITGATGTVLSFTTAANQDGNLYQAVITNSQGTVTTAPAKLTVSNIPFMFGLAPQPQVVNQGDTVTFTASATGSGVTVQWQVSTDQGNTFTNIAGATTPTLTFVADISQSGNLYKANFIDLTGFSGGGSAGLVVNAAPAAPIITAQPVNTTATAGGNATLTVGTVAGNDPTVQWQVQGTTPTANIPAASTMSLLTAAVLNTASTSTGFTDIAGATGTTVTLPIPSTGVTRYRAVITNIDGTVTTSVVTVSANKMSIVSNDLTTLKSAIASARSAIAVCQKTTNALVAKLTADLRTLKATKAEKALLSNLATSEKASRLRFISDQSKVLSALLRAASRATGDAALVKKHPGVATYQSRLQSDITALNTAAAASTAPADATDCRFATATQLAPISSAFPTATQLQNDIAGGLASAQNIGQSLQAPMAIALQIASTLGADALS